MSVGGWVNPASRYVQQGMQRYGPGSAYNNNAWIQAALAPYVPGGARSSYNAPRPVTTPQPGSPFAYPTTTAPVTQRPITQNQNPRSAANVIAAAINRNRQPQYTPQPTGVGNQTQVRYPNGSQTTYNIMPNDPRPSIPTAPQQVVNPGNTWGIHAGPGVTNAGNILNAPLELGLGPFAQYLQNTATAAAHEGNMDQFRGSAPPPVARPPVTGGSGGGGQTPQPNRPQTPTPTPSTPNRGTSGGSTMTTSLPGHVVIRQPNGALRSVPYNEVSDAMRGQIQANYLPQWDRWREQQGSGYQSRYEGYSNITQSPAYMNLLRQIGGR